MEKNKDVKGGERGVWEGKMWSWQWDWIREVRGRALEELEELCSLVRRCELKKDGMDKWKWLLGKEDWFSALRI